MFASFAQEECQSEVVPNQLVTGNMLAVLACNLIIDSMQYCMWPPVNTFTQAKQHFRRQDMSQLPEDEHRTVS